jgi:hypothetical protein
MEDSTEVAVRETSSDVAVRPDMTIEELVGQVQLIQDAMKVVMQDGVHYGVIPGTEKPTLYKPGAEKLCLLFRLDPEYGIQETYDGNHYTVRATCTLFHVATGNRQGSGEGLCTTKEKRYASRSAGRVCPACGKDAIIKGKEEYGGGWVCFKKKDGCGAKFSDDDPVIVGQATGTVENPELPDLYNTVLKMACKRALVAAVLNVTAASDLFTQDMEDVRTPVKPEDPKANAKALKGLKKALEECSDTPELWAVDVVLANASRRFGRKIDALPDLTQDEAEAITVGAIKWLAENPVDEVVEDAEVVDDGIEFAPEMPVVDLREI